MRRERRNVFLPPRIPTRDARVVMQARVAS